MGLERRGDTVQPDLKVDISEEKSRIVDLTLCRFHHRAVHEGKVVVHVLNDGAIRFLQPNGQSFDSVAPNYTHPISDWRHLTKRHEDCGVVINAHTAVTHWDGEPMDFGMGVDGLLRRWRAGKQNPPCGGQEEQR